MRNFTRDVELRLLLAMTHTEYQVCSLRYIHFFIYLFFFIFGLRFFMIVCLCNCRSLRQSCFVTLIPTRGRVSWNPPSIIIRLLCDNYSPSPPGGFHTLQFSLLFANEMITTEYHADIYIHFFLFPFCCLWFMFGVTFGPILTTSLRFSPYDGCKIDLKSLTRWIPLKIVQNIIAGSENGMCQNWHASFSGEHSKRSPLSEKCGSVFNALLSLEHLLTWYSVQRGVAEQLNGTTPGAWAQGTHKNTSSAKRRSLLEQPTCSCTVVWERRCWKYVSSI